MADMFYAAKVGQRVWHVQTGAPGTVLAVDGDQLVVRFDGADNGVPIGSSRVMHTDPGYFGTRTWR